jgi:hypothetical protein
MREDPSDPVCTQCIHGSDYCVNSCDYFLISKLHEKYQDETETLFLRIQKETLERIESEPFDDDYDPDDEETAEDEL